MQIKFIGTGGAFDIEYLNSSAIVTLNNVNILIDCGHSIFPALRRLNATSRIDYVLITHFHDDHIGSLSSLAAYCKIFEGRKLKLLWPELILVEQLNEILKHTLQKPDAYFDFQPISELPNVGFINTFGKHVPDGISYAYYFEEAENRIVYSGDIGDCDFLFDAIKKLPEKKTSVFHEIFFNPLAKAHTYYKDLMPYSSDYEIYGYHCDPRKNPPDNPIKLVQNLPELLLSHK